jgi:asparagine synthase (glutamine-hydrolysing)
MGGKSNLMCGIAGILHLGDGERRQTEPLHRMTGSMVRRGPDDEGFVLFRSDGSARTFGGDDTPEGGPDTRSVPGYPNRHIRSAHEEPSRVALGHRRLSVVDLTGHGHQPMVTADGRYWIVYNGEIYNHREIAGELSRDGVHLHGRSDTEVLLNAFARWGEACLSRFNGMFAFAIWDTRENELFCARDRIGIKPFYYTWQDGQFIFASDIKALLASGLYKPRPDMEGVSLAMALGMAPRPKTAFADVVALEQAHWMRVRADGHISRQRYWSIPVGTQDHAMNESDAVALLEEQLVRAVRRRLVADVPVGTFMSGGIDSTTISALAAGLHPGIQAFTLGYEDTAPEMDEVPQAEATARMCPMSHVVHRIDPAETLVDLEAWIDGYEEPHHNISPTHAISKLARDRGVTVVLNGLGGDELFAGYHWYAHARIWQMLRSFSPIVCALSRLIGGRSAYACRISRARSADRLHTVEFMKGSDRVRQAVLSGPGTVNVNTVEWVHDAYARDQVFEDALEALSYMDLMNYIGNHYVHRVDQFTMAHSIEGRFPFLDHELVEAAMRIPTRWRLRGKTPKYVLRRVAARHIAPECLSMLKKGFGLPLRQWMDGPLAPIVQRKLSLLKEREYVNATALDDLIEACRVDRTPLWHWVMLEMWFERFIDGRDLNLGFG